MAARPKSLAAVDQAWWTDFRALLEQVLDEKLHKAVDAIRAEIQVGRDDLDGGVAPYSSIGQAEIQLEGDTAGLRTASVEMKTHKSSTKQDAFMQVKDLEEHYEGLYEVTRAFNLLCARDRPTISAQELVDMRARHQQKGGIASPEMVIMQEKYSKSIHLVNETFTNKPSNSSKGEVVLKPNDEISLDTFTTIMHRQDEFSALKPEQLQDLREIREILLKEETFRKVAQCTNTAVEELQGVNRAGLQSGRMERAMSFLDPCVGAVILLNAFVIVLSVDFERGSGVWDWIELVFACIFLLELVLRMFLSGLQGFFTGPDWAWNIFDTVVVIISSMAMFFARLQLKFGFGDLTLMRLMRFARLTKLVRVLKLKAFAELVMLVNGIVIGMRTLLWVVVFMLFLLIFLGVVLTDTLGQEETAGDLHTYCDPGLMGERCRKAAEHLESHGRELFGSLFRSMFTAFRCLTDGCSSVDGTPLIPYFLQTMGPWTVIMYMLIFIFVTFGLFNLIMAVFVENTLDGAKRLETKRKEAQKNEHIRIARKLQELIVLFCRGDSGEEQVEGSGKRKNMLQRMKTGFRDYFATRANSTFLNDQIKDIHVSSEVFVQMCSRAEVQNLLADLDIDVDRSRALFDVIDANNDGTLEVTELVQGLLRLRGVGDRTEAVESLLAIKAMQRSLKAVEVLGLRQQELVQKIATQKQVRQPPPARGLAPGLASLFGGGTAAQGTLAV